MANEWINIANSYKREDDNKASKCCSTQGIHGYLMFKESRTDESLKMHNYVVNCVSLVPCDKLCINKNSSISIVYHICSLSMFIHE